MQIAIKILDLQVKKRLKALAPENLKRHACCVRQPCLLSPAVALRTHIPVAVVQTTRSIAATQSFVILVRLR